MSLVALSCSRGSGDVDSIDGDDGACVGCPDGTGGSDGSGGDSGNVADSYELVPDFTGPCELASGAVDVNLGHTAESAVRALHCQIVGREPDAAVLAEWAGYLTNRSFTRRVDVARTFCQWQSRECQFRYGDPWQGQVLHEETCERKTTREMGAVMMFFGVCPGGVNCGMNWANTHALGMDSYHFLYGTESNDAGYYYPGNAGFWKRELLDARWAGLQFLMLNVYGPDIVGSPNVLERLSEALAEVDGINVALFDDTWVWGRDPAGNLAGVWGATVGAPFTSKPNWDDVDASAQTLFDSKWKVFFQGVPKERWYRYEGKPLVYFYNAGTFHDKSYNAPAILGRMKELFANEFGETPFVVVDSAFFPDGANAAADGRFTWDAGAGKPRSSFTLDSGVRIDHSMVRWDSVNRYAQAMTDVADETDRVFKGPADLSEYLITSVDADLAILATWNDLGEGTGVNRNYDYFHGGAWLPPNHFMSLIRQSQCSN